MKKILITLALVASAASMSACGSGSASSVDWDQYAPTVKSDIDAAKAAKDCNGLQVSFDTADANHKRRPENANLMGYIDSAMKEAGCYK